MVEAKRKVLFLPGIEFTAKNLPCRRRVKIASWIGALPSTGTGRKRGRRF